MFSHTASSNMEMGGKGNAMASLKELERDGLTGFDPEWDDYTGRAYRWRVHAGRRSWFIGLNHERASDCSYLATLVSTAEWRKAVAKNIKETDDEVSVEITYKDYQDGRPISRLSVLRGITYPVVVRTVRGGEQKPSVQWAQGAPYEHDERHPAPTESEMLNAAIGMDVRWYVFAWSGDGWEHIASVATDEHKDALVSLLKKDGRETYVAAKQG